MCLVTPRGGLAENDQIDPSNWFPFQLRHAKSAPAATDHYRLPSFGESSKPTPFHRMLATHCKERQNSRRERDSRPRYRFRYSGFQDARFLAAFTRFGHLQSYQSLQVGVSTSHSAIIVLRLVPQEPTQAVLAVGRSLLRSRVV
jgi:hypothetical protein